MLPRSGESEAVMKNSEDASSAAPRINWQAAAPGWQGIQWRARQHRGKTDHPENQNLIQAISIDGTSPRDISRWRPRPRETRSMQGSARYGETAGRRALVRFFRLTFFSDNGNESLSSLAAVAGGGVTIETRCNFRIGREPKKR